MTRSGTTLLQTRAEKSWCVYLLECQDGSLYTGITNKLAQRFAAHQLGKGARYTRSHPPKRILGSLAFEGRSQASIAEHQIKKLRRPQKLALFKATQPDDLP